MRYEIDEAKRVLMLDLVSAGSADRVLKATVDLITQRPELCSWDWIVECEPMTDDATVQHLAKLAEAWGTPPLVEAVTIFVTNDRMLHLWARVLDFQFVRRKHFIERDINVARQFVARRQSARIAKMNGK
ncbi:hypothetical protein [Brevundimonas sp. Leaf168]|uniref:hypothetical protein n=1 Tax=Brevundimonas sp. Leaf168 TaxID=1736283 RepID=UPI0006F62481|nr:hypothetical protein [Brevundimonas sp. Leaf168]KQR61379.1 hypothetical protein ASF81_02390 [Brevundimonas sp. Leaf168]